MLILSTDISSANALSFLYSYSRCVLQNQVNVINMEMIERLNQVIVTTLQSMNETEMIHLLSIYNNLNYFPESISQLFGRLTNKIWNLTDDQCFTVLCCITKSQSD